MDSAERHGEIAADHPVLRGPRPRYPKLLPVPCPKCGALISAAHDTECWRCEAHFSDEQMRTLAEEAGY